MEDRKKKANILCIIAICLFAYCLVTVLGYATWSDISENIDNNVKETVNKIFDILTILAVPMHLASLTILCYAKIKFKEHTLSNVLFWCLLIETIIVVLLLIAAVMMMYITYMACNGCMNTTIDLFRSCPG